MDIRHISSVLWAIGKNQRLLWKLVAVQAVLSLVVMAISETLQFSFDVDPETLQSEVWWVWGVSFTLFGLLLFILIGLVQMVITVAVVEVVHRAYDHPERVVTWAEVRQVLWEKVLRWLGVSLLWLVAGLVLALVVVLVVGLLSAGAAVFAFLAEGDVEGLIALLLGIGSIVGFFLLCVGVLLGMLFLPPFWWGTTLGAVLEERPFFEAVRRGLALVRRTFLWWVLVNVLSWVGAVVVGLLSIPFVLLYQVLFVLRTETMNWGWVLLLPSWLVQSIPTLLTMLWNVGLLMTYVAVYRFFQRAQATIGPGTPAPQEPGLSPESPSPPWATSPEEGT